MKLLSRNAKIYVVCMIAAAPLLSLLLVPGMRLQRPVEFALLTLLAGLTATLKVTLPATMGTMSVAYTVVIATILLLGPAQAMIVGAFSAASQCLWQVKEKAPLHRTLFSISTVALTAGISGLVFQASLKVLGSRDMQAIATALLIATSVYFLLNSVTISVAIGLSAKKPLWETWHQNFLWTAPGFYFGSLLALIMSEFVRRMGLSVFLLTVPPVYIIYHSYKIYMARVEDGYRHLKEMEKLHLSTIEALALAIDAKDQVTHGHLQRVQVYAEGLAKALGLDEREIQGIRAGALLHDIGKLAIPDYILNKPGKLTRKEFQKMSIHPLVGAEILSAVNFPYPVADLVLNHHERWDGAGYPKGLKKEEIPIGARILSVVDCFDALSSDRPYRKALSLEKALEYVVSERGRSFDPRVVDTLMALHGTLAPQAYKAATKARNLSLQETVDELSATLEGRAPHSLSPFENISAAHQELSALYELVEVIGTSLNLSETLQLITEKIKKLIPNSLCGFYFLEEERLVPKYLEGVNETLFEKVSFPLEGSVFGWALRNRHPILNANLYEVLKPLESLS
ncbi:MAG: HD-GYP domain-containing protein, partial [Acidobacteria bacterium]|nr:HD-GYP domain-containing protein [Acidobacteriota bacterium]